MKLPYCIVPAIAGLSLMLAAASCTHEAPRASPSRLPFGALDTPRTGDVIRGRTLFRGWALDESGIQSVAIYLDRNLAAFATLGIDRPDVQKAFPAMPGAATAGWELHFDTTSIEPGRHEIVVQARSPEGATRDLGTATVTVAAP
jgi:Bacterial Ig domain